MNHPTTTRPGNRPPGRLSGNDVFPRAVAILAALCATLLSACATAPAAPDCSPQALDVSSSEHVLTHPDGRQTQVTLWQPTSPGRYPLMVFAHGAYAAPERYEALLGPLSAMGFVVLAPLHIDSELLASDPPPPPDEVWRTRKEDVQALLGAPPELLAFLNPGVELTPDKIAAGHSYGAFGAQVAAGAAAVNDPPGQVAPGVRAVVTFSPPGLVPGFIDAAAWDQLVRPQLLLTGNADILPGFMEDWRNHAAAFEKAPAGDQWLWVGEGVDHYFGNVFGRLQREAPDQRPQFEQALAVTQRFLAEYLPGGLAVCTDPLEPGRTTLATLERR